MNAKFAAILALIGMVLQTILVGVDCMQTGFERGSGHFSGAGAGKAVDLIGGESGFTVFPPAVRRES